MLTNAFKNFFLFVEEIITLDVFPKKTYRLKTIKVIAKNQYRKRG